MSYPNYDYTYPKINNPNNTTGYSGPMVIDLNGKKINGIIDANDNRALVRASIERIIGTSNGERVMRPNFGTNLKSLLFEPLDGFLIEDIKETLKNNIMVQEPRIIVDNIEFDTDVERMTIKILISFKYINQRIPDTYAFALQY